MNLRARIVAGCCGLGSLASLFFERRTTGATFEALHGLTSILFIAMMAILAITIIQARSAAPKPPPVNRDGEA